MRTLLAAILLVAACAPPNPLPGYGLASADEHAAVVRTLEDYYAMRGRAIATGDIAPLLSAHPKLASGEDRTKGINYERLFVFDLMRGLGHNELKVDIRGYEPIRVWVKDGTAAAFVHGLESYPNRDGRDTVMEFYTRFDLAGDRDRWTIERSDALMLGEGAPPRTPVP